MVAMVLPLAGGAATLLAFLLADLVSRPRTLLLQGPGGAGGAEGAEAAAFADAMARGDYRGAERVARMVLGRARRGQ